MTMDVQPPTTLPHLEPLLQGAARSLTWGVKASFRSYFERLPDHAYDLTDGAERMEDGRFRYPGGQASGPGEGGFWTLSFSGRLELTAHFGALSVLIADPEIHFTPQGEATLSAVVDESGGQAVRMVIADLALQELVGESSQEVEFAASLARDGQYLFMGNYFAGDPLDPIGISLGPIPALGLQKARKIASASASAGS